jgi:flavodoxin I
MPGIKIKTALKEVGILYGSSSGKTESVALKIYRKLGSEIAEMHNIQDAFPADLLEYRIIIMGIPTWGVGEPQDDWKEFFIRLDEMDLSGRKVALFGLGDQESYPGTFANALGILYEKLENTGCEIIGGWPVEEYDFKKSSAVRNGVFAGLVIDEENQPEMTGYRIDRWLKMILQDLWASS